MKPKDRSCDNNSDRGNPRSLDGGSFNLNGELDPFEDQLRQLRPRAAAFVLPESTSQSDSMVTTTSVAVASVNHHRLGALALAASLLLMWGLGAGMGAAAAFTWMGRPGDSPAAQENFEVAQASPETLSAVDHVEHIEEDLDSNDTLSDRTQGPVSNDIAPANWTARAYGFPWMALRAESTTHSRTWTPKTAYFIAHQSEPASFRLPWFEDFPATQSVQLDGGESSVPVELTPFNPQPPVNQREQLRGLLNDPGRLF